MCVCVSYRDRRRESRVLQGFCLSVCLFVCCLIITVFELEALPWVILSNSYKVVTVVMFISVNDSFFLLFKFIDHPELFCLGQEGVQVLERIFFFLCHLNGDLDL